MRQGCVSVLMPEQEAAPSLEHREKTVRLGGQHAGRGKGEQSMWDHTVQDNKGVKMAHRRRDRATL